MLKLTILLALATVGIAQDDAEAPQNKEDETIISLNFSNQGITSLNEYDFSKYPQLEELDLSDNDVQYIKEDVLSQNGHLKKLNLSGNKNLQLPEFSTLLIANIEELSLSNCNIEQVPANIFDGLTNLKVIDLSDNPLEENGIQSSTLLAIEDLHKMILPSIHESMIKEICEALDTTTIAIQSPGYSDSIACADVQQGKWQNILKEEPNQDSSTNDEEYQPEINYGDDDINVEIKRQVQNDEDALGNDEHQEKDDVANVALQPSPAEGADIEKNTAGEDTETEPKPSDQQTEDNIGLPLSTADNEEHGEAQPAVHENENPDNEQEKTPMHDNEPQPSAQDDTNLENNSDIDPKASAPLNENATENASNNPQPQENPESEYPAEHEASPQETENPTGPAPSEEEREVPKPEAPENSYVTKSSPREPGSSAEIKPSPSEMENSESKNNTELQPTVVLENTESKPENEDQKISDTGAKAENTPPVGDVTETIDGIGIPDAVDGKHAVNDENQKGIPEESNKPVAVQRGLINAAPPQDSEGNQPRSAIATNPADEVKAEGSSKPASAGSTVLVVLVIAVIVAGAAAFGYKFYKTRTYQATRSTEPVERELKEIVVETKTNGSNIPKNPVEEEPLIEQLQKGVENKEIIQESQTQKEVTKDVARSEIAAATSISSGPYAPTTTQIKPPQLNKDDKAN